MVGQSHSQQSKMHPITKFTMKCICIFRQMSLFSHIQPTVCFYFRQRDTTQDLWGFNLNNQMLLSLFAVLSVDCWILASVLICSAFIFTQGGKWMCSVASILPVISPRLLCVSGGLWWGVWPSIITQSPTLPHIWCCFCVNCALWGF